LYCVLDEIVANLMPATHQRPPLLDNGLVYVDANLPGWRRVKRGKAFGYRDAAGRWLRDADEIARIRRLAIPPAYRDVWICPLANGHLQATGVDARGRKQYRYHADWRALQDETKFDRLEAFGRALPKIRSRVARDLKEAARAPLDKKVVLATIVRLLDTTFLRVGNEEYASSNGSYGLTTLRNKHADVRGASLKLRFRGKSGVMHEAQVSDARVSKIVRRCQQLPGQELFQYQDEEGGVHGISSTDVNDYLREVAGENFTAKDFRTWHGTAEALELTRLACDGKDGIEAPNVQRYNAKEILGEVAARLGNTPAVCKKAYVHPAVLALGATLADDTKAMSEIWEQIASRTRSTRHLRASEARLLEFLVHHRRSGKRRARAKLELAATQRGDAHSPRPKAKKPSLCGAGLIGAVRA
jgi:DNA topoisomerase-1